ncbi:hypothetical protein FQR65_LT10204 [Abscondita terminalis]|nr:hypothetical protein FQR65_LT10204 [Abscondita terminalis]
MEFKNQNITILYGSQTGNAQEVAERIWRESKRYYFLGSVKCMDDYDIHNIVNETCVIFVCSTTGQGDEPDNMKIFWKHLLRKNIPTNLLKNLRFAVLGLGDSSYVRFNFAAKRLSKRLTQLGANVLLPIGLADDQHDLGYDGVVDPWIDSLYNQLLALYPLQIGIKPLNISDCFKPKWCVTQFEFIVTVKEIERTTCPSHFQDVRLVKLQTQGQHYVPGDVVVIRPKNLPSHITEFQNLLNCNGIDISPNEVFKITEINRDVPVPAPLQNAVTFQQLCEEYFDLNAVPRRHFFQILSLLTDNEIEKEKLQEFATAEGQNDLYNYCNRPRRNVVEVLQDFPHALKNVTKKVLFEIFHPIKPREFSIASSFKAHSNEIHILLGVVRYKTRLVKERLGLCSNYLANLRVGDQIRVWIKKGSFKFPTEPDVPVILVGPGTGMAPFRSFICEREQENRNNSNRVLFFFGCRGRDLDFHCKKDFIRLEKEDQLKLVCAFSRDQGEKIYVQHKILEHGELVWQMLRNENVRIYIAGNAKNMPQQVREAFVDVCKVHGGMTPEGSVQFIDKEDSEKVPLQHQRPVRLQPSWEESNLPEDELNFRNLTMDEASLELHTPMDKYKLVYMTFILNGIGVLMPWNMFITAENYFTKFKLHKDYTGENLIYGSSYLQFVGFASQVPNLLFNWLNIFIQIGGSLTTRIVWSICIEVAVFILTVALAMTDTHEWPGAFFWITMVSVVILNMANGVYQNTIFGMAAKLPSQYTGAVVLGTNISGTFTAIVRILSDTFASTLRMSAIYYFIAALFVLLSCFDTYFALPLNRYYRHYELKEKRDANIGKNQSAGVKERIPYFYVFKKSFPQLLNVFLVFFVTLSIFPAINANIEASDPNFFLTKKYFQSVTCFLTFNVFAMCGSYLTSFFAYPGPKYLWIPAVLRFAYIPFYLLCNYQPFEDHTRALPVLINNDWAYWIVGVTMGLSSGYLSSLGMMYASKTVEERYAATAGMFAAASLITGIFSGVMSSFLWPCRPFWSILCDVDEKFDQNCLEISKINSENDRIIIGSHVGILRIYQPSFEIKQDGVPDDYQPSDLLIEKIFPEPILQISTGRLVSGSSKLYVAVLYPKSVAVYGLVTKEGATEHGTQNMLPIIYEHKLKRSAANFCIGPFGGVPTRDFICIQSLDGMLIFFEQESFAFCCFLPEFLLPGPLVYVQKSDSFVTVSSSWCLTSFRYKNLSEAGHNSNEDDYVSTRVKSMWSYNLGEEVLELRFTTDINNTAFIVVLGTRNLYCLSENGIPRFIKRLDFTPICLCTYTLEDENSLWSLVVSETNTLLIYLNTTLKWAAQLSYLPIAIGRGFFKNIQGALVSLTEDGKLTCSYLGTEPHLFSTTPLAHQDLDYEKAETELDSLIKIIRNYYSSDMKLFNSTAEKELQVSLNVKPCLSDVNSSCEVLVTLMPNIILEEVQVTAKVSKPLKCSNEIIFFKNLTQNAILETKVYFEEPLPCSSLKLDVVVSYISNMGVPKVIKKTVNLPLQLLVNYSESTKEHKRKIILNVVEEAPSLSQLFPDFLRERASSSNKIGFKSNNEKFQFTACILTRGNEFQVISSSATTLNVIISDLISKLKKQNCSTVYKNSLPTLELFEFIRKHFEQLQIVKEIQAKLSLLSGQFRLIQKKLISKYKDKNPNSLFNMEMLLEETYLKIISCGSQLEIELEKSTKTQIELKCLLELFSTLIEIADVDKNIVPILQTAFCPFVYDSETQVWEDVMETCVCYLLYTIFSRSEGEKIKMTTCEEIKDITKLELHVTQVLDRIRRPNAIEEHLGGNRDV